MRVRSTDSSARSGFAASTTRSVGAPAGARSSGATSGRVIASDSPAPTRRRRRGAGRAGGASVAPTWSRGRGTVRPIAAKPTRRATSSTRSISRSRSGRNVGATAVSSSPEPDTSMPSGASAPTTSASVSCVPSTPLTLLVRRRMSSARIGIRVLVDGFRRDARAGDLGEELHRPVRVHRDPVGIDAPLEARARLGAQLEPLRRSRDPHPLEVRRLEQDLGRRAPTTSDVAPPMIPAIACGTRAASQMRRSSVVEVAFDAVERGHALPASASRTTMPRPASRPRSKACSGWLRSSST